MTKHIIKLMIILIISVSEQAIAKSASETARDFFNLLKEENYGAAASYYDPVALREFRLLVGSPKDFFEPDLTDESTKNLSDSDFLAAFMRGILGSESFSKIIDYENVEILGELKEREDLVHVVVRNWISLEDNKVEVVEVISFNKTGSEWKVRMTGKLKSIAILLRQQAMLQ